MYNRYIPSTHAYRPTAEKYTPFREDTQDKQFPASEGGWQRTAQTGSAATVLRGLFGRDKFGSISELLKGFMPGRLEMGDLLLVLIALLLLAEEDEPDFVLILGIVLLLGLGGDKKNRHPDGVQPSECRRDAD